jgi:hypothetical protein
MSTNQENESQFSAIPQRIGVPIHASIGHDTIEFINDIEDIIPIEIREQFYGVAHRILGLAKLTPRQAEALILQTKNLVDMAIMSIPSWKANDPVFLMKLYNLEQIIKMQCWRATTLDIVHNERAFISQSTTINEQRTPTQAVRKRKFLGLF